MVASALAVLVLVGLPIWITARDAPLPSVALEHLTEASTTAEAIAAAVRQRSEVVVAELTTESRIVRANADGQLVAEISIGPVRVRRGNGWADVDTTLRRQADGMVKPLAAVMDIAFSGGGSVPLLRYGTGERWIELSWAASLPAPAVAGDQATYAEVYPGVDLVMQATRTGYSQKLIVKNADAAKNKALTEVVFGLRAQGVSLTTLADGGLEAKDEAGVRVFAAQPSRMWDSAAQPKEAPVGVSVTGTGLTLKPDVALLSDPGVTFPLIIDPDQDAGRTNYNQTYSGKAGTAYPNKTAEPNGWHQVGQCWDGAGECKGIGAARLYLEFGTEFLNGKEIHESWLNTTSVYGPNWNCSQTQRHTLHWANWGIGEGTTWNNQPTGTHLSNADILHSNSHCPGSRGVGFFAGTWVNNWGGRSTYYLSAANESDQSAWRKYDPWAHRLWVKYNTKPNAPADPAVSPARPKCGLCDVPYLADNMVQVGARLSDNDGDQVAPVWVITGIDEFQGGAKNSGEYFQTDVDLSKRADGARVKWSVKARDWGNDGPKVDGPEFAVDRSPVDKMPIVTGDLYKEDGRWHGGAGVPGKFTFDPNGITDIAHYEYGWDGATTEIVTLTRFSETVTTTIVPPKDGPRDLFVRSVDRAGRKSEARVLHLYIRPGSGPVANWSFEGNTRDTAHLGDRDGTLIGAASYAPSAVGNGLLLDGWMHGSMSAPSALNTTVSFSASAWVRIDDPAHPRAVVSQDGPHAPGFVLWYRPDNGGQWVFGLPASPTSTSPEWAKAPAGADLGKWTHLAGVYDAPGKQLRLYVNGRLTATAARVHVPWAATGVVRVGRTLWDGRLVDDWHGGIDEVQLYDRQLTAAEIRAAVARDNVALGHWKFDEAAGTTTAVNAVPGGASGVLLDGAQLTGPVGGIAAGSVRLGGDPAHVSMGGPVVRTDGSFSVAAWLQLDVAPGDLDARCAVAQEGEVVGAFGICYRQLGTKGYWEVFGASMDVHADNRPGDAVIRSAQPAQLGVPAHVAAVFNAAEQKIVLYVNGEVAGQGAWANRFRANGPFTIGRFKWNGTLGNHWKGLVDEVRAYSRILDTAEIQGIVAQNKVAQGWWKLDGDLRDSSPANLHGAEPSGKVDFVAGQSNLPTPHDLAAQFTGANYVSAGHAIDTRYSFSATAWTRLDKKGAAATVVSQDGNRVSAFQLQATAEGRWAFVMYGSDVDGGGGAAAHHRVTGPLAQTGVWTHLAGVYDAAAGQLYLYVNGELAGSTVHSNAWDVASGKLSVGAAKWNNARAEFLSGAVDDVIVLGRTLFADEVRQMAGRDLSLIHHWALDEPSGKFAADSVGDKVGTLTGSPERAIGRVGNAVRFDGTDDAITSTGLGLRTDQSFTVAAWVYLEKVTCPPGEWCKRVAVSADGPDGSKFRLGHLIDDGDNQYGSWFFELPDLDIEVPHVAAVHADPRDFERWVHLAGVYDQAAGTLWIYVDGVRQGDGFLQNPWNTSSGVVIGRGKADGAAGERWKGNVDDVRVYTGTLDTDRVSKLFASYPAPKAPVTLPANAAAHWKLNEDASDASGNGRTLNLNGAGWIGGRDGMAITLDGTTSHAVSPTPVLNPAQNFSATAWVYLSDLDNGDRTVLSQNGVNVTSFDLRYQASTRKWAVTLPLVDSEGTTWVSVTSAEPAQAHNWVHLATTYETASQQLRLYVNGVLSAHRVGIAPITNMGAFNIGRGWQRGNGINYFKYVIDEVRAYQRTLTDGEVRALHDSAVAATYGAFRFDDGTAIDSSWRKNPVATSGTETYAPGISGKGLKLDGVSGSIRTTYDGVRMDDSFSVAAWAKLDHKNQVATVMAQEGVRTHGFMLQYRPQIDRWVFGAPAQDEDGSPLVYASAPVPVQAGEWVHLAGVYDFAGRQLRLYVNGELAGVKDDVALWKAVGGLVIGRGRIETKRAEFFPGTLDEVYTYVGMFTEANLKTLSTWPATTAGQLGRYVNLAGERYSAPSGLPIIAGYWMEANLGAPIPAASADTAMLYRCVAGTDLFTSADPLCGGEKVLGEFALVYKRQPANVATVPIYQCANATGRYESTRPECEGGNASTGVLGYTLAYSLLSRYYGGQGEHWTESISTAPGYRLEGPHGWVPMVAQPGTVALMSCRDKYDQFLSVSATCEGKAVLRTLGYIWPSAPSGVDSAALYLCKINEQLFAARESNCSGFTVVSRLGYVLHGPQNPTPQFS